jgi:hypothetical protein
MRLMRGFIFGARIPTLCPSGHPAPMVRTAMMTFLPSQPRRDRACRGSDPDRQHRRGAGGRGGSFVLPRRADLRSAAGDPDRDPRGKPDRALPGAAESVSRTVRAFPRGPQSRSPGASARACSPSPRRRSSRHAVRSGSSAALRVWPRSSGS